MCENSSYIVYIVNTNEIKTYRLIIKGKVQNVGFRHWFSDLAISLGLNGYVQNKESKDEVEAIIQGDMQSILSMNNFIQLNLKTILWLTLKLNYYWKILREPGVDIAHQ